MGDLLNRMIRLSYRVAYLVLRAWWFLRRPQTHGACVALWHGGEVLMVRTSYRDCYSLPGGFVGRHESTEQAARRELLEELGIDLQGRPLKLAWSGTLPFESRGDSVDIWEASVEQIPDLTVSGREIVWAGWLSPSDALMLRLLPHIAAYLVEH
jgi:8-oxo-dGTP diphosphatase